MIDESRTEKAVMFLRDTAQEYGQLRGHLAFCDANLRRVKSIQMLLQPTGSVADREATAYASCEYLQAITDLQNATAEYETMRARREAAEATIEVWRSQASAKKQGVNL